MRCIYLLSDIMKLNTLFTTTCIALAFSQNTFADHQADDHAPAGVMYEHLHQKGQWMVGYNVQRLQQNGDYYSGSEPASANAMASYGMLSDKHEMYMHMLHLMYAPTDNLTLMLMPMYMSMDMRMGSNPQPSDPNDINSHEMHASSASHRVIGWGDTILSASYRAFDDGQHQVITTLGLSAPTGDYKKYGDDGNPVHYGMQLGAGVWQVIPTINYIYTAGKSKLGLQLSTRQPIFNEVNKLGYYPGDQRSATAWLSYLWHPNLSTSARIKYSNTDTIQGHYKLSHNHSAPADFQENYGGEQTFAGLGVNTVIPFAGGLRTGVEYMIPIHENLNGVQQRTASIWNVSINKSF